MAAADSSTGGASRDAAPEDAATGRRPQRWWFWTFPAHGGESMLLARAGWLLATGMTVLLGVAGLIPAYRHSLTVAPTTDLPYLWQLSPADVRALAGFGVSLSAFTLYHMAAMCVFAAGFFVVAIVIFAHKSHEGIGILVSLTLVMIGANRMWWALDALYRAQPALGLPITLIATSGIPCLVLFLYFFPDGYAVPAWTRGPVIVATGLLLLWGVGSGDWLGGWRDVISGTWLGGLGTLLTVGLLVGGWWPRSIATTGLRQRPGGGRRNGWCWVSPRPSPCWSRSSPSMPASPRSARPVGLATFSSSRSSRA